MFPYIVAWSQEAGVVRVFNLIHQKCVQEIPFSVRTTVLLFSSVFQTCKSLSLDLSHSCFISLLACHTHKTHTQTHTHSSTLSITHSLTLSFISHAQSGRYMTELSGKLYVARDKSVYLLSAQPLKEQVLHINFH